MVSHCHQLIQSRALVALSPEFVDQRKARIAHCERQQLFVCGRAIALRTQLGGEGAIGCKGEMARSVSVLEPAFEIERPGVTLQLKLHMRADGHRLLPR